MKNLIQKLIDIGIDDSTLPNEKVKMRVLNSFSLLASFLSPFFAIGLYLNGFWQPAIVFLTICTWLIVSLFFHHKKKYNLFKFSLFSCIGLAIPFISVSLGLESGFSIHYLIVPVIGFHIFKLNEINKITLLFLYFFLSFISNQFLHYIPSYPWVDLSSETQEMLFNLNVFIALLFIVLISYSIVKTESAFYSQLEKTIDEKNILLAEVHHRVKNNLAVISSMLRLQMKGSNSDKMNDLLLNNSNRIHSMSQTHNKLYVQSDISNIKFDDYIVGLVDHLRDSYEEIVKVKVEYDLKPMTIGLNEATTIGLVVNEIITNSIKHAFVEGMDPIIKVKLAQKDNDFQLTISDNGIGFDFETHGNDESIGVILIDSLINQINGSFQFVNHKGSSYEITFPTKVV